MLNTTRTTVGTRVSDAAEEALEATTHALDSSRQFATETAARIGESARGLRDSAADLARTSAESVSEATAAAQRQLGQYAKAARRYVADEPVKSALIAAAIGAAAAALVLAVTRSRRHDR